MPRKNGYSKKKDKKEIQNENYEEYLKTLYGEK